MYAQNFSRKYLTLKFIYCWKPKLNCYLVPLAPSLKLYSLTHLYIYINHVCLRCQFTIYTALLIVLFNCILVVCCLDATVFSMHPYKFCFNFSFSRYTNTERVICNSLQIFNTTSYKHKCI